MVKAKFKVDSIEHFKEHATLRMTPVTTGSKENESFFKWTPSGRLEFACLNAEATKQFEVGKEYYLTFEKAGE